MILHNSENKSEVYLNPEPTGNAGDSRVAAFHLMVKLLVHTQPIINLPLIP